MLEETKQALKLIKELNKKFNHLNVISEDLALEQAKTAKGKLKGFFFTVKDCLTVKEVESKSGSKILTNYKPLFNATAVQKVIDEGGIILGKTAQDAFGFGSFSTNVGKDLKIPKNPVDPTRSCGG